MLPEFPTTKLIPILEKYRAITESHVLQDVQEHIFTHDAIHELIHELDQSGFIAPFDWMKWSRQLPENWQTNTSLLDDADLDMLRRLLTAHIRLERFHDRHLDSLFRNGYMAVLFGRLQLLLNTNN